MFVPIRPRAPGVAPLLCLALTGLVHAGCGRGATATTAVTETAGPRPPTGGFEFPSLAVEWTPPMLSAGDLEGLAAAIGRHAQVRLVLGPRLAGAAWEQRGAGMIRALGATSQVTEIGHEAMSAVAGPEAELLALRRDAATASGRPRYAAAVTVAGTGGPVVALDDAAVDLRRWQALASSSVGSCEPAMRALADGQEAGLTELAPFLDHADSVMDRLYRAGLRGTVPGLITACGAGAQEYLQQFVGCVGDPKATCPGTPRLVLVGGARIVATPLPAVPEGCAVDVAARLRAQADAAAETATIELDRGWTVLADRLGALTEVHAALEDVCVPRRRRFADADLAEARARLGRIGVALASEEVRASGRWLFRGDSLAVPGLGVTRVLASFEAGEGSVNASIVAEARALREFVLGRGLCKAGHSATPMAAVVGVPGQAAEFFGYFYEEELVCGELPPLRG